MTYENFLKVMLQLEKQDMELRKLQERKVDLIDFVEPYQGIISALIKEIYGEEGWDWFCWYCYENEYGAGKFEAWDENKNTICQSHKSLWEHMESIRTKQQ